MSKLDTLIQQLCPDGVEYKKLGDIATITRGGNLQKKDFTDIGIPCIHYGQIYTKYGLFADKTFTFISKQSASKQKYAEPNDIVMAVTSENLEDVCKCVAWLGDVPAAVSGHTAIIHHGQNPKYLCYYFHSSHFQNQKNRMAHGTKVIEVTPNKLTDILLPVPPLEIQCEIVRILNNFAELTGKLTAELSVELTARKKQYEYYQTKLFSFGDATVYMPLAEIAEIGTGSSNTNEELAEGKYPFFVRSQDVRRKNEYEYDETAIITSGDGVGVGRIFHYIEGKYALHQRAYRIHITDERIIPKYFYYYMKATFLPYIEKASFHSSVTSIRRPMLNKFPVPVVSIDQQNRIVSILDRFDVLCNDLTSGLPAEIEARQKQYEYYRDKLLTFKPLA